MNCDEDKERQFLYNALQDGWSITKNGERSYAMRSDDRTKAQVALGALVRKYLRKTRLHPRQNE